jgi:glycosyltransferase involved in cell wall biosynthesis
MHFLSVVTITRNSSHTLPSTLRSVRSLAECLPSFSIEHIFIDSVSVDSTCELITDYARHSPSNLSVTLLSEPDDGIYNAMNKGLYLASGAYLAFLNSDDFFLVDSLAELLLRLREAPSLAILSPHLVGTSLSDSTIERPTYSSRLPPLLNLLLGAKPLHDSFIVSSRIARSFSFSRSYRILSDHHWMIAVIRASYSEDPRSIAIGQDPTTFYSIGGFSSTLSGRLISLYEFFLYYIGEYKLLGPLFLASRLIVSFRASIARALFAAL